MRRSALLVCCVLMIAAGMCSSACAEKWVAGSIYRNFGVDWSSSTVWFEFNNNELTLGGSDYFHGETTYFQPEIGLELGSFELDLYGKWAVCGTISDNQLIPDPYATFVETTPGQGYITWASDAPAGYVAPLMLGAKFDGFSDHYEIFDFMDGATGHYTSMVWREWHTVREGGMSYVVNDPGSHTFYATAPVPEPASALSLLLGSGSLIAYVKRRR